MVLQRYERNPIISRSDIPDITPRIVDPSAVFNPGAAKVGDRTVLLLRIQTRGRRTHLVTAWSDDGVKFEVTDHIAELGVEEQSEATIHHVYDPRVTPIEGAYVITVAMDTDQGCRMGIVKTSDFESFEYLGETNDKDVRNGVIFPEQVGGHYVRFDRPNDIGDADETRTGDRVVLSTSDDLLSWQPFETTFSGRPSYWDERVGSGPPPIKTRGGWLHIYHGVATHLGSSNIYQAGVILLDLDYPYRVLARGADNILEPREIYETVGQVPNVVFPTGLIVETYDDEGYAEPESAIRLYYGAADTCVATATTTVRRLIDACGD